MDKTNEKPEQLDDTDRRDIQPSDVPFWGRVFAIVVMNAITATALWPIWHFLGVPLLQLPEATWDQMWFTATAVQAVANTHRDIF